MFLRKKSNISTHFHHHGRAQYGFDRPSFDHDTDHVVSPFEDDSSFTAAEAVVEHFQHAKDICERLKKALIDCMEHVNLERYDTQLTACMHRMKVQYHVDIMIITDSQLPYVALPSGQVRQDVALACDCLNEAVKLSFELTNEEKHKETQKRMYFVKQFRNKNYRSLEAVQELEKYMEFMNSVKKQAEFFVSDFLDSMHYVSCTE